MKNPFKLLFLFLVLPTFLFGSIMRETTNFKARKSTWEIWRETTIIVSELDTVVSDSAIEIINAGWHGVQVKGTQTNDSIQIQLQYAVSFYNDTTYWNNTAWHDIVTYTSNLYDVIQFYPPTSRYLKFRRIGLADNGYNAQLFLRYAFWNIE